MPDLETIIQHFKISKYDQVTPSLLTSITDKRQQCLIESTAIDALFNTLINNPNNKLYQAYLYYRYAMFHLSEKHYKTAIQAGKQALSLKDSINLRLKLIKWLIADKQFDEAMELLQETKKQLNPLKRKLYYKELTFFETKIPVMQELHEMGFQTDEK
ncbi:hypothetical protein QUF50_09130 [Thiotrichales bacterium HSG1]|nr:hypothetical protein [Thiotrichales bacterium HSG1]